MTDGLPPDPFKAGLSDLAVFAANSYSMYASLLGAGFTEMQALEFTIRVTAQLIAVSMPPQEKRGEDAA